MMKHEAAEEQWLLEKADREGLGSLRSQRRRAAQARIRAGQHKRQEYGLHRPPRALVLTGLRAELEHRGLLKEWEPVPADAPKSCQMLDGTGPHAGTGLMMGILENGCDRASVMTTAG
ncbi:hypothetical protein Sros01_67740 [Streptomyces roseochromogenus]|nr:hypothetical protein Sros01_67740 [Streptomyces roseochromogenus]